LSQYEFTIQYICGELNTVADALSHVAPNAFPGEASELIPVHVVWRTSIVSTTLSIMTDACVLKELQEGYKANDFCKKFTQAG
jgi:hypothetical protein